MLDHKYVLLAFEVLHYMKNKRRSNIAHMAIKLDMSKVFDRVEWDYLKQMMLKLGFFRKMGGSHHGMYLIGNIFYYVEWSAQGVYQA